MPDTIAAFSLPPFRSGRVRSLAFSGALLIVRRKEKVAMVRPHDFSPATKQTALERQKHRCGSCGTRIVALGKAGRFRHEFGEGSQAHHIKHIKLGGNKSLDNCVILCDSCHYSVHEGGNYRFGTVVGRSTDFPHYNG